MWTDCAAENQVPLLEVNLSLFADDVGETSSKTLDRGHGVHDVLLAVNIGVQHTQNMLKVVGGDQRLHKQRQQISNELDEEHTKRKAFCCRAVYLPPCCLGFRQIAHSGATFQCCVTRERHKPAVLDGVTQNNPKNTPVTLRNLRSNWL